MPNREGRLWEGAQLREERQVPSQDTCCLWTLKIFLQFGLENFFSLILTCQSELWNFGFHDFVFVEFVFIDLKFQFYD